MKIQAEDLARAGNFGPAALEINAQLVAADPHDLDARCRLARCYASANRFDEAEAEYSAVLERRPGHSIATNWLPRIRLQRRLGGIDPDEFMRQPPGPLFGGFAQRDFVELGLCARDSFHERFNPRLLDLVERLNSLPAAQAIVEDGLTGFRRLFRVGAGDIHWQTGHWYIFHLGGRWTPQFNIGMFSDLHHPASWVRIGVGFNSSLLGLSPNPAEGQARVRAYLTSVQNALRGGGVWRRMFIDWMTAEEGVLESDRLTFARGQMEPEAAADWIQEQDVTQTEWIFFGKWLRLHQSEEREILAHPALLLRTIDRVLTGLGPVWRWILTKTRF